jgi:hypothetical protein
VIKPVPDEAALLIKTPNELALVVADLHLGIEGELAGKGISLPSQTPKISRKLVGLIEKYCPDRLILLGDVKHNVPIASWQEWRELPELLRRLGELTKVEIVPGNHDGDLAAMVPKNVALHDVRGLVIGKRRRVGLAHGHAWPGAELFRTEKLVLAHNHPAIEFRDRLGGRLVEPVWLRVKLNMAKLPERIRSGLRKAPELLVIPAFGELVSGAPVNRAVPKELIGPLFKSRVADMESAQVHMLDGTFLGKVQALKKLFG